MTNTFILQIPVCMCDLCKTNSWYNWTYCERKKECKRKGKPFSWFDVKETPKKRGKNKKRKKKGSRNKNKKILRYGEQ